ncbi:MAG: hypothetical protein NTY45_06570 [Elusimicrobia bacterium]|nr:hypothetical protein [Elusimicrobiota bacterium]
MKTQKTMKLSKGVEVLCREDDPGKPYTCADRLQAEEKVVALGTGWTVYQGKGSKFYVARKKGVAKHEKLLLAKLGNGIEVLAIGGGKHLGMPRLWGGINGLANAARNAKALGSDWRVYHVEGEYYAVVPVNQRNKLSVVPGVANASAGQLKESDAKTRKQTLPPEKVIAICTALLAGNDYKAVTAEEKEAKAEIIKDIAYAKKMGYQIYFPNDCYGMPKEKKVRYYLQGVPTDAQLRILAKKLAADEKVRVANQPPDDAAVRPPLPGAHRRRHKAV